MKGTDIVCIRLLAVTFDVLNVMRTVVMQYGKLVNNQPVLSKGHNHEADPKLHLYVTFQHALFEATVSRPFRSFRLIYDQLSVVHYEAAVKFTCQNEASYGKLAPP
ncbi:hypothetical protein KQX54_000802 [Cotesia glomerata]|uniref:Uncharacterized protein n=1 Tax=Cotesia glomerata TaxID=32391 RepID=A0AAV7HVZ1_COTGL|nr:hypothetical protein KQX54_000802 [Cotesia glomerata]